MSERKRRSQIVREAGAGRPETWSGPRAVVRQDGLEQIAGPPVMQEENALVDAPQWRRSDFVRPGEMDAPLRAPQTAQQQCFQLPLQSAGALSASPG